MSLTAIKPSADFTLLLLFEVFLKYLKKLYNKIEYCKDIMIIRYSMLNQTNVSPFCLFPVSRLSFTAIFGLVCFDPQLLHFNQLTFGHH